MLPTIHSWLFTSGHIVEFFNNAGSQLQAKHEHFMFVGLALIVMLFIAVFAVIKEKNSSLIALHRNSVSTSLAIILFIFVVTPRVGDFSIYQHKVYHFPGFDLTKPLTFSMYNL